MNLVKTRGVILNTMEYKEKDRLLHVFTLEYGKISVLARGTRGTKGRFQAAAQPMMLCDFVLFPGKSLYQLNEAVVIHSFSHVKTDFDRIAYGSYFLELTDIAMPDHEVNERFFLDLMKAMYLLDQPGIAVEQLARAFEMKTLVRTGNLPDPALAQGMPESARLLIRNLLNKPLEEMMQQVCEAADLAIAGQLTKQLLDENFQRKPKSLEILQSSY
ncbi:DNA repair protein RecO [Proteiniclasticum sp. QWL-01]|uniref:DNA repair protein RecO n=1 Tax=Proteiniclasticum sp. QWL-01 TaxID=3036945 RepID=UPI0024118D19|nr:DNA repair protein RecO [Proteiniclasticum sp. QWL-01]WFF74136.1 DNA repair protein RecO [Proteiniclasticum sp. QWL-01]